MGRDTGDVVSGARALGDCDVWEKTLDAGTLVAVDHASSFREGKGPNDANVPYGYNTQPGVRGKIYAWYNQLSLSSS